MKSLRSRIAPGYLGVIVTLLLVACGQSLSSSEPTAGSASSVREGQAAIDEATAPDFAISTGDGTIFTLSDHRGDVVVLYFSFPG